jgi:hypothetical protein
MNEPRTGVVSRRRIGKLWRVLVVGGALVGVACGTTGKPKDGKETSSSKGDSGGAAEAGGAKSW